jgi:hypothetical protein
MSLFRRNKRAPDEGDEAAATESGLTGAEHQTADQPADAVSFETPAVAGDREPGELDALVGEAPSSRRRGKLRRRLRHLRRVREVLLRDLGGLTFELHRTGAGEGGHVLEGKLGRLAAVDQEIRALEDQLADHRAMIVREPGIGGTCEQCGELFGSEARYCWACGSPVAVGSGGAPHLAAWTTHPQLMGGAEPAVATPLQSPSVDSTWVDQEHPTAPLPQMDPDTVAAEEPAANEPATGDVGGDDGAVWSTFAAAPAVEPPAQPQAEAEPAAEAPPEPQPDAEPAAPAAEAPTGPEAWIPPREEDPAPELSSGDPLAGPQRPAQP